MKKKKDLSLKIQLQSAWHKPLTWNQRQNLLPSFWVTAGRLLQWWCLPLVLVSELTKQCLPGPLSIHKFHKHCSEIINVAQNRDFPNFFSSPLKPQGDFFFWGNCSHPSRIVLPHSGWVTIKCWQQQIVGDITSIRTCQCPNFCENFRSPSTDWTKGLRSGQTTCQSFHLLFFAWQGHFPQEPDGHAAISGKKDSGFTPQSICKMFTEHFNMCATTF